MDKRYFEFQEGKSNKFWGVWVDGDELTTHFGRIGTAGQTRTKTLDSAELAQAECDKLISQKLRKGYWERSATIQDSSEPASGGSDQKSARRTKNAASESTAKKTAAGKATRKKTAGKKTETPAKKESGKQPEQGEISEIRTIDDLLRELDKRRAAQTVSVVETPSRQCSPRGESDAWERVSVRSVHESLRTERLQIESYVKAPFPTSGGVCSGMLPWHLSNQNKWFCGVAISDYSWIPLFSNVADSKAIFDTSAKSRRLEVVATGYDPAEHGWYFLMNQAGKVAVHYQLPVKFENQPGKAKFKAKQLGDDFIQDCDSGRAAVDKLCRHYEVDVAAYRLELHDGRARMVDAAGAVISSQRVDYCFQQYGPALEAGENAASDLLAAGIVESDEARIRQAIADGARLDVLPESSITPLREALLYADQPNGLNCVKTLVELGCPIDGSPGDTPPIINCWRDPVRLECLLSLGANPNAPDPESGRTALHASVQEHVRADAMEQVRLLLKHGADPTVPDKSGRSTIDHLKKDIERAAKLDSAFKSHQKMQETLSMLTGDAVWLPDWEGVTEYSAKVRPEIAECAGADLASVTPDAGFFAELDGSTASFRQLVLRLETRLEKAISPVVDHMTALAQVDANGHVTAESLSRLEAFVPGSSPVKQNVRITDLFAVSMIEAIVAQAPETAADGIAEASESEDEEKARSSREFPGVASMIEGMTRAARETPEWVRRLPEELDQRRLRLLLAGTCRFLFNLKTRGPIRPEFADSIEAIERFADTGKSAAALKSTQQTFRGQWIDTRRTWRNAPENTGLLKSMDLDNPEHAVPDLIDAMAKTFGLTPSRAVEEFNRLRSDVVSPLADATEFRDEWRTEQVAGIAREMNHACDFGRMSHLADALQQAGCNNQRILDHCRDPQFVHMRGCWVLDLILAGIRETASKTTGSRSQKSPLSRYPKAAQNEVRRAMQRGYGDLPFEQYLAQRWDLKGHWKHVTGRGAQSRVQLSHDSLSRKRPDLSDEQISLLMPLGELAADLKSVSIARRVVRDDPAELGRGLTMWVRLRQALGGGRAFRGGYRGLLEVSAAREFEVARDVVDSWLPARDRKRLENLHVLDWVLAAMFRKDVEELEQAALEVAKRKMPEWLARCCAALSSGERRPQLVAEGINGNLEIVRKSRHKYDDLDGIVNLCAHGLYRLCEWIDPELVTEFDTRQPYPWDAEFHGWFDEHPDPLEGMDLTTISPVLHQIVIMRQPPTWLRPN